MQTFMYVVGPFLMQAGIGLGATLGALGWIFTRGLPGLKLRQAKAKEAEAGAKRLERHTRAMRYAEDAQSLICNIMVRDDVTLPDALVPQATALASTPIDSYIDTKELH